MEDVEESQQVSREKQANVEQHRSRIQKTSGCLDLCSVTEHTMGSANSISIVHITMIKNHACICPTVSFSSPLPLGSRGQSSHLSADTVNNSR